MRTKHFFFCMYILFSTQHIIAQLTQESYDNLQNNYNYTFWNDNFKTVNVPDREFTIQTSDFGLKINYSDLTISNMDINTSSLSSDEAFVLSDATLFPTSTTGEINYRILQNGNILHEKAANPTNSGIKISQMSEYGTWLNRRFLDSLNYTNGANIYGTFSGIEFTSWHNRLKMTFYVKPRTTISNGQLQLEIAMPAIYSAFYNSGEIFGFANSEDIGFAIKGGTNSNSTIVNGGVITTTLAEQNLIAGNLYQVSLIIYAVKQNLSNTFTEIFDDADNFVITSNQTLPNTTGTVSISYDQNEGIYFLDIPKYTMGQYNCASADLLQNIQFGKIQPIKTNEFDYVFVKYLL
jgi:hypothetical protein